MIQTELENCLFSWVDFVMNPPGTTNPVVIIWEAENGVRPASSYLQLNITATRFVGMPEKSLVDSVTGVQQIAYQGQGTLSIQAFEDGSCDYLHSLRESINMEASMDFATSKGLTIVGTEEIQAIPEIVDNVVEKRWHMDVFFTFSEVVSDKVGFIEKVEYSGEF